MVRRRRGWGWLATFEGFLLSGGHFFQDLSAATIFLCYFRGFLTFGGVVTFRSLWYTTKSNVVQMDSGYSIIIKYMEK